MIGRQGITAAIVAAAFLAAVMFVVDAASRRAREEVRAARARVEAVKEAEGRRNEIEALSDDDLLSRLGRWILPDGAP